MRETLFQLGSDLSSVVKQIGENPPQREAARLGGRTGRGQGQARKDAAGKQGEVSPVGSYQGTLGAFIELRADVKWADIAERNGEIRRRPVEWLGHATGRTK